MDHQEPEEISEEQPPGIGSQNFPFLTQSFSRGSEVFKHPHFGHDIFDHASLSVVSDIDQCKLLWEGFSQNTSLFDTWEFRYAFYLGYSYRPHFIVISQHDEVIGLLPLWYETDQEQYSWFGSYWQEDNRFFVQDKRLIPILLAAAPSPLSLVAFLPEHLPQEYIHMFQEDESKYILDLSNINSLDDYLNGLKKKKRYNIRRDIRIIEERHPKVFYDRFEDFDHLVDLSKHRFNEKGSEADWIDPRRVETFRQVISLGRSTGTYTPHMITVEIDGEIASVDLLILHRDWYRAVKCAYNVSSFPGIGIYVNTLEITDAINLGYSKMDFLQTNCGWKDSWFTTKPLVKFEK